MKLECFFVKSFMDYVAYKVKTLSSIVRKAFETLFFKDFSSGRFMFIPGFHNIKSGMQV